tara:strand:- start:6605 stop:7279 length:675 start_codon:yes stop_codon:yes gene_type:complete
MLQIKNKRILPYLLLFFLLGSINNKNLNDNQFFKLKNLQLFGLNEDERQNLLLQLDEIKNENIFLLSKEKIKKILDSNNLIDSFLINKNYPSDLNIFVKRTSFLANINIDKKNYFIGSNKKLINSNFADPDLPTILGNPAVNDFFLIRDDILKSLVNFEDIKKFYFFPSKRWDLEFKNGILIKLPINNALDSLNNYYKIKSFPQFENTKTFDMRINEQMIINEL